MPHQIVSRSGRIAAISIVSALCLSPAPSTAADGWPSEVSATYDVNFNGLNIGSYEFSSNHSGNSYKLASNARLSLMLGALRWSGSTEASGQLAGETAKPQKFGFDYKAQSKSGSTRMSFTDDTVTQILNDPPPKIKDGVIPVQAQHLKGVLDPLSAVMALTRSSSGNPCVHRIPVFDGTQRFDLILSPKGTAPPPDAKTGASVPGSVVCKVRYVPIAGYKPDENSRYLAHNNDIEVVLRPMPNTSIYVPQKVTLPTIAGNATLVARRVNVVTNGRSQLAFMAD